VRKNGTCPWLRPDGKTQVTVEYRKEGGAVVPIRVHTILISTQHSPGEAPRAGREGGRGPEWWPRAAGAWAAAGRWSRRVRSQLQARGRVCIPVAQPLLPQLTQLPPRPPGPPPQT
jgi:hypothetical protein